MNKKKVEAALLEIAAHMRQCITCVEALLSAGDSKANPACAEYKRLKAIAKKLAGQEAP